MTKDKASDMPPLAVVAGGGVLPFEIARSVEAVGRQVIMIGLADEPSDVLETWPVHYRLKWGEVGRLFELLKQHRCQDVVFVGSVSKRPDFKSIRLDFGAVRLLPRILRILVGGDDQVLRGVLGIFEDRGHRIVSVPDIAPELIAQSGHMTRQRLSSDNQLDVERASAALGVLGDFDVGQAAVAVRGRIVAVEGAEGTDAMIDRVGALRTSGRINWPNGHGVLVKVSKPGQDIRVDLPTIGPNTVLVAEKAGLAGLAVQAGRVLIAERERTLQLADQAGLFLFGFEVAEAGDV
ncbi:LpxI family protein [Coralliovum pocilloporae]|uniref:LpxI family protein n=1 Tax=Coralliovum pocilloporae TaxID=3066369 RepID=UPI003307C313